MRKLYFVYVIFVAAFLVTCKPQQKVPVADKKQVDLKIDYEKYTLANGLEVILHSDHSDPIVALAVQYHVGSNREETGHTGFAHLFEHMMFQRSENVGEDQFFKFIQDAGGTLNGGTNNDATTYYEIVPKNALEKILWLESDRMGFLINTVTQKAFNIQQNVVQNEKRQNYDNRPYGHSQTVVAKYLYPAGHPYSWTVIGDMKDLFDATVEDVKQFHQKFYVPNNATLVLAGDFEVSDAKKLIEKYFGEIKRGNDVKDPEPKRITLNSTVKVYHEDNFARASQFRMIWPTVEQYTADAYALSYLNELLSNGKKAPLYKVLEKEKKLTSNYFASSNSRELAGEFSIMVTANAGVSLKDVEAAIFEALNRFETEGFTDADVERIKAGLESRFYNRIGSILGKSFQLATYNEYAGNPSFYKNDIENLKAVTKADILRVYNQYIKGKHYLATSFVPKGKLDLVAEGSVKADIKEENVLNATEVAIEDTKEEEIKKTPSVFDRSVVPQDKEVPTLNIPIVWHEKLANNLPVYGIEQNELPLVQFSLVLKGGHYLDKKEKSGVAFLVSALMMEGTQNRTPQELEEAIEKLGARIFFQTSNDNITLTINTLSRNFDEVLALAEEMLLQPRWDAEEFEMAKTALLNNIMRGKADPTSLARNAFAKLVYGENHILSVAATGTEQTVASITIEDLKEFYATNFSPSVASLHIAGNITKEKATKSFASLGNKWAAKEVKFPQYSTPAAPDASKIYFIDVPDAKQSVINIGCLSLARTDADFFKATVMNHKLGGSFNSHVNMVLREEKGFTYGARTNFAGSFFAGTFLAASNVRSTATLESVQIFKDLMEKYSQNISAEDLQFTKNALIKSNALEFETLAALITMLQNISQFQLPFDYVKGEEEAVRNMTAEQHCELAKKYINPNRMYYVIAGDAKTQKDLLKNIGMGEAILMQ